MHVRVRDAGVGESSGSLCDELPGCAGTDGAGGKALVGGGNRVGDDVVVLPLDCVADVDGDSVRLVFEAADEDGVGGGGFLTTRRGARTPGAGNKKHQ